ncbi:class I SAM-dependent methyltransferase [Kribbella sp. CA-253562]|uniref:class I SAM-dependent methyltransferase n=1 Tax=Kribbella sp. CA-253562 TaxID=3239942 RepID=UPI003D90E536
MNHQPSQYDALAEAYAEIEWPLRTWVEVPSVVRVLGDVAGQSVLDVGCGEGLYSRLVSRLGATHVVATDASEEMIKQARERESVDQLGIEYLVGHAASLGEMGEFDLALAIHLLHYASDVRELLAMTTALASRIRSGGRLVGVVLNPDFDHGQQTQQFGFRLRPHAGGDGDAVVMDLYPDAAGSTHQPFSLHAHYYRRPTYEHALRAAGFRTISWHRFELAANAPTGQTAEVWEPVLQNPYADIFECVRAA